MIHRACRAAALLLTSAGLFGCGGADRTSPVVPVVARPVAAAEVAAEPADADASQPQDLAVLMRLRNPEETLDALSFVTGTPLSLIVAVAGNIDDAKVLSSIDLRVPVDAAVLAPPGMGLSGSDEVPSAPPLLGFTFGVTHVDRFLSLVPDATVSRARRDGTVRLSVSDVVCSVPAVGAAPARVVCASSDEALRRLGPWLTHTLAQVPPPAVDARLSLFAAPARDGLRTLVAGELREEALSARESLGGLGISDPELLGLPDQVLDEMVALAEDAERLDIEIDLDPATRTARARYEASFRSTSSWVARVLTDATQHRAPPPPIFWRAPRDAEAASWGLAAHPSHFASMRRIMSKVVSVAGARGGLTPDETAAVVGVVDGLPAYGGAWVSANGQLPWKAPPKGNVTPQNALADFQDRARAYLGWGVVGVEMPAAAWERWVVDVEKAWRKVLAGAKRGLPADTGLDEAPEARLVRAPPGYPRGTVALDFVARVDSEVAWSMSPRLMPDADGVSPSHPAGPRQRATLRLRFVVVPDGDRTFLGWSVDDAVLRAHVRAALRDAPEAGTITARSDLQALRQPSTGGGFFTVRSWVELALDAASGELAAGDAELDLFREAIGRMPHGGATAILTRSDGSAGPHPKLSFELLLQEGTVDDLRALGQFSVGRGLRTLILGRGALDDGPDAVEAPVMPAPWP